VRTNRDQKDPWSSATWEGAEESVLAIGARMSLPERLRWLEEAAASARSLAGDRLRCDAASEVAEPSSREPNASES